MCIDNCEGQKVSTYCIVKEGNKYDFTSFDALIDYLVNTTKDLTAKHKIDVKILSQSNLDRDEIIQLLIDKVIQLNKPQVVSSNECNLDIHLIDDCSDCNKNFCEKLQLMVNKIAFLESQINQINGL